MFSQPPWVQKEVRREKIKISKVSRNLGSSCCQDNREGGSVLLTETLDDVRSHSKGSQPYDGPFCLIDDRNNGKRLSPKAVSKGVSRITEHQPHPVPWSFSTVHNTRTLLQLYIQETLVAEIKIFSTVEDMCFRANIELNYRIRMDFLLWRWKLNFLSATCIILCFCSFYFVFAQEFIDRLVDWS